jgi:hypothetical protein
LVKSVIVYPQEKPRRSEGQKGLAFAIRHSPRKWRRWQITDFTDFTDRGRSRIGRAGDIE